MKIAHFFANTINQGDAGSAAGIQTLIRSQLYDTKFDIFNVNDKSLGYLDINRINKDYDRIIIGGGGILYNRPKKASQFNLNISLKNFKRLKMKKAFFGVGINVEHSENKRWNMAINTEKNIKEFMAHSELIGVRDIRTMDYLESLGIKHAVLTPCPSMFLLNSTETKKKKNMAAINLTKRTIDEEVAKTLLENFREFTKKQGLEPVFVIHDYSEDRYLAELAAQKRLNIFNPVSPENLMEFYQEQQFLTGMRGHSLIFATGACIPMTALSYNAKCDAHMELIGAQDYIIRKELFNDREYLFEKLQKMIDNYEIIVKKLREKRTEYLENNLEFVKKIISPS